MEVQEEAKRPRLKGQPVWMPIELYERLQAVKARHGGTLSGHARLAVEAYVARHERKAEKETRGGA
jgi:predicted DNA-binding protein